MRSEKLCGILMGAMLAFTSPASAGDGALWKTNYKAGVAQAKKEGKPLIIKFMAPW